MQHFVRACLSQPSSDRQRALLARIVPQPKLHARWLNTLARLEYVGVRKMLKARRSETLDLEGLRHVVEEAVHATRLKKAAIAVTGDAALVETFAEEYTLCGDAAERYFQAIDHEAARLVRSSGHPNAEFACYLVTSAAIELRAQSFYPAYQAVLEANQSPISVSSIIGDEQAHLEHMAQQLPECLPHWRDVLSQVMRVEEQHFMGYLDLVEALLDARRDKAP